MKNNKIQSVKNNGIKNIVKCCLIIVFVNAFWACKKYETETRVHEVRIVSASITEVGTTTADFTIVISGNRWALDGWGAYFWGYAPDASFSWTDREEYWDMDLGTMYKVVFRMEGLWPGANYACQAYLRLDTLEVEGEIVYFTTAIE